MTSQTAGSTLCIADVVELSAVNSQAFVREVRAGLHESTTSLDIDLASTRFMDSAGVGALFSIYRAAGSEVTLRLLNAKPNIRQLLELTQMDKFYDIVKP
jgi:anti-anti-sigma factor